MAKYKEMIPYKPMPEWIDTNFTATNVTNDGFHLAIGPIRIILTREEMDRTVKFWQQNDDKCA